MGDVDVIVGRAGGGCIVITEVHTVDLVGRPRDPETSHLALPPGERHALYDVAPEDGAVHALFRGRPLVVRGDSAGEVLFPTDVGVSLLTALDHETGVVLAGKRVLDVGCGSGIYTVGALLDGAKSVTVIDINPAAIATTLANTRENGLPAQAVRPLVGDLATVVIEGPWEVVLCNPPHFPDDPRYACADGLQAALVGGVDGRALYDVLLARLDELLSPDGVLVLAHSSLTDIDRTRAELNKLGFTCRTVQVCELDMPLRRYATHRDRLLARLYALRRSNRSKFCGLRFEVHVLVVRRNGKDD